MRKITKRSAAIITAAVVAVGGAGAAWAAWSSTGNATVSATAGSAKNLTVTGLAVTGTLTPGNPVSVAFTVGNPNDYAVKISSLALDVSSKKGGCDKANFETSAAPGPVLTGTTTPAANASIAKAGSASITWAQAVKLVSNPDNACQGADFEVKVVVAADSAA